MPRYSGPLRLGEELREIERYRLDERSRCVLIGGYQGTTARILHDLYRPQIFAFDPQLAMIEQLRELVPEARAFPYALGIRSGTFPMREVGNDACSFFGEWNAPGSPATRDGGEGRMRHISRVFRELHLRTIDLLFMNCEGSEFELLPYMSARGILARCRYLLIQFHTVAASEERYREVRAIVDQTHRLRWDSGPSWVSWERRSE